MLRVAKFYRNVVRRFLRSGSGVVSEHSVREYLKGYLNMAPKTYNNQLDGLRAFINRFLGCPEIMVSFRKAPVPDNYDIILPTKEQLQAGFESLMDDRQRAIYLFTATTGLRRGEVWGVEIPDVDFETRAVKSKHQTRTKRAGVTFYNSECEDYLLDYFNARDDGKDRLFVIGTRNWLRVWKIASKAAGFKIRPQVLRRWQSTMLGELGVPDRFVDVFQGRAPSSVLAKFYTGRGLKRLKRIYEKAGLRVLG